MESTPTFGRVSSIKPIKFSFYIRHAIEVNKRDYRAWYGLGQTYEILRMPFYCLYYYRKAHQLRFVENAFLQKQYCNLAMVHEVVFGLRMYDSFYRPNDSRMLVALGESYEKLSQQAEAKKVGCSRYSISPLIVKV